MTITHAEFFHTLRHLLQHAEHELTPAGATIRLDEGHVEIRLGPEGQRPLGRFHLPRTLVELRFLDCPPPAIEAFIARFDRHFRRGGG